MIELLVAQQKVTKRWITDYYLDDNDVIRSKSGRKIKFQERHPLVAGAINALIGLGVGILVWNLIPPIPFQLPAGEATYTSNLLVIIKISVAVLAGINIFMQAVSVAIYKELYIRIKHDREMKKIDALFSKEKMKTVEINKNRLHITVQLAEDIHSWKNSYLSLQEKKDLLSSEEQSEIQASIDKTWVLINKYNALPEESKTNFSQETEKVRDQLVKLKNIYTNLMLLAQSRGYDQFTEAATELDEFLIQNEAKQMELIID